MTNSFSFDLISAPMESRCSIGYIGKTGSQRFFLKTHNDSCESNVQFYQEGKAYEALNDLDHIVPCLGYYDFHGTTCRVYPFIESSLVDYVRKLSAFDIKSLILLPLLKTLEQMHNKGWVHGDIKLDNIRIEATETGMKVYLSDFGKCTFFLNSHIANKLGALPQHIAPDTAIGPQFDVYALGVLAYQLLFGFDFIKNFQMAGRTFEWMPEAKDIEQSLLQFIEQATSPTAVNRLKSAAQAMDVLNGIKSDGPLKVETYNLAHCFELYLECMSLTFKNSERSSREFEEFAGPWGAKYYARLKKWLSIKQTHLVHLKMGNDIVGICEATLIDADKGMINTIFLREDVRGKGYGEILEKSAISFFKSQGRCFMTLNVSEQNYRAIRFYTRLGWTRSLENSRYPGAILMHKKITSSLFQKIAIPKFI